MIKASELAQLGVCEQLVVFEQLHGRKRTAQQRRAIERGNAAHRAFFDQAIAAEPRVETSEETRCFIATATFGVKSSETQLLRRFRDDILAPRPVGRWVILCYYRISPPIAKLIGQSSWLKRVFAASLRPIIWMARLWLQVRSNRRNG
jgi:hypothetical protein